MVFPGEVEATLAGEYGIDVRDWLRWAFAGADNDVTSRRVWNLLRFASEDSPLREAMREGDWTDDTYLKAAIVNEIKNLRANYIQAHDGKWQPELILSPAQRQKSEEERQANRDVISMFRAQIHGEYQPPAREVGFVSETDIEKKRGEAGQKAIEGVSS